VAELSGRLRDPKRRLADIRIALDDNVDRLRMSLAHLREVRRQEWVNLTVRLEHKNPRPWIGERLRYVGNLAKALRTARERQNEREKNRLRAATALLESFSPLAVLNRGYSITRRFPDGAILRHAEEYSIGQHVDICLSSGNLHARITDIFL
jgi:exodeoxyribonuclease VII large subunit